MAEHKHHILSNFTIFKVWLLLVILTGITVSVTHFNLGAFAVGVALLVACVKSTLVLTYFMHLKYDDKILTAFIFIVMLVFTSFIVLTLIDYIYR